MTREADTPKRWQRRARRETMTEIDAVLKRFPKEKAIIEAIPDKEKRELVKLRILAELKKGVASVAGRN